MSSESDSDSSQDNAAEIPAEFEEERLQFREKLSTMSFEELQRLKEQIGTKQFNKATCTDQSSKFKTFMRPSKNHPQEISSKVKPSFRNSNVTTKQTKAKARDPRFDPLCGKFEEQTFKDNYKFVDGLRRKERAELEKELLKTDDEKRQKQIKYLMQRIDNKLRESSKLEAKQDQHRQEMRSAKQKLKLGEKPVFKKKSEKRVEALISQYEELKKTNKLQKHIEKRAKKLHNKSAIR